MEARVKSQGSVALAGVWALTLVSALFPFCFTQTRFLYCVVHNRRWQQRRRWDSITCRVAFESKHNPQHYSSMCLSRLIYWAPFSSVPALYVPFDLLALMVSLKISSSISCAILKPLKLPEREDGEREKAHSQFDVYLAFSTGLWLGVLWLLAEHIRLAEALPALAVGHHTLDDEFP